MLHERVDTRGVTDYPVAHARARANYQTKEGVMRVVMMLAVLASACGVDQPPPSCAEIGAPDTLLCDKAGTCSYQGQTCTVSPPATEAPVASRLDACGAAPIEPVLDPATLTDSHGDQYVILYPDHWATDAAFMDASKAWADCMVYGVQR